MATLLIQLIGARVEAVAAAPAHQGRLLEGLNGVLVLEATASPELAAVGQTPAALRDALLQALHGASVPVLEPREDLVLAAVALSLAGVEASPDRWALCAVLELKERATLCREPSVSFDAATWTGTATATCSSPHLQAECGAIIREVARQLSTALRGESSGSHRAGQQGHEADEPR